MLVGGRGNATLSFPELSCLLMSVTEQTFMKGLTLFIEDISQ